MSEIISLVDYKIIYEKKSSNSVARFDILNNSKLLSLNDSANDNTTYLLDWEKNIVVQSYYLPKDRYSYDEIPFPIKIEFTENEKYLIVYYGDYVPKIYHESFYLKIDNGCYGYVIFNVETGAIYRDFQYEGINVFRITSQGKYILYEDNKTKKLTFGEIIYNN